MKLLDFALDHVSRLEITDTTRQSYRQAVLWACRYFGDDRELATITNSDFVGYLEFLLLKLATNSAKRHAKRLRAILSDAMARGLIDSNPGQGVNLYSATGRNIPLVSLDDTLRILDQCPTADWMAMVALSRFAGMRPVEVLELEWRHVHRDRLKVYNTRTGFRDCPLFAPLREVLEYAREVPERSPTHVLSNLRDHTNATTQLQRIIRRAGLHVPKPFYSFTLSRRRELLDDFPREAVNDWLRFDRRVPIGSTRDDWQRALALECGYRVPVLPWQS